MPSKKGTIGYVARQTRVKGTRALNYIYKQLKSSKLSPVQRQLTKAAAKQLTEAIAGSYLGRGKQTKRLVQGVQENVAKIESMVLNTKMLHGKHGAANFATQQMLNMATRSYKGEDADLDAAANPSPYSREQVKLFYKSTQRIWQNEEGPTDTSQINRKIMQYFKTPSLEEAFNRAMSNSTVKAQLEISENIRKHGGKVDLSELTPEAQKFYKETLAADNDQESQSSPTYLRAVVQFDPDKSWREQVDEEGEKELPDMRGLRH